jgi:hypothetical protein
MIEYSAIIKSISAATNEISAATYDRGGYVGDGLTSNTADIFSVCNTQANVGATPFLLSHSKLGGGHTFAPNKVNYPILSVYFISGKGVPEIYNVYIICAAPAQGLTIAFDTYNNRYPAKTSFGNTTASIYINGKYFDIDSAITYFPVETKTGSVGEYKDVQLYDISVSGGMDDAGSKNGKYPTIISGINIGVRYAVDKINMVDMDISQSDRPTNNKPIFGVMSGTASLKVKDDGGELLGYVQNKTIGRNSPVEFIIKNSTANKQQSVAKMLISDLKYDVNNFNIDLELSDGLLELQETESNEIKMSTTPMTAKAVFERLKAYVTKYEFAVTANAETIMSSTTIKYPFLEQSKVWAAFDKLCNLCGLYMYMGADGKIVIDTQLLS